MGFWTNRTLGCLRTGFAPRRSRRSTGLSGLFGRSNRLVDVIEDFMTEEECQQVIALASQRLRKSMTWDIAAGREKEDDYRVSDQMFFARGETELIRRIE